MDPNSPAVVDLNASDLLAIEPDERMELDENENVEETEHIEENKGTDLENVNENTEGDEGTRGYRKSRSKSPWMPPSRPPPHQPWQTTTPG